MGFYYRKGVKFGYFRLNFSKSGVGVSDGVKAQEFPPVRAAFTFTLERTVFITNKKSAVYLFSLASYFCDWCQRHNFRLNGFGSRDGLHPVARLGLLFFD
jgi:hypothetical protein